MPDDASRRRATIRISERAARRIAELIAEDGSPGMMLRVAVSGGGCSGFQYGFTLDDQRHADDRVVRARRRRRGDRRDVARPAARLRARLRRGPDRLLLRDQEPERHPPPAAAARRSRSAADLACRTSPRPRPSRARRHAKIATWNVNSIKARLPHRAALAARGGARRRAAAGDQGRRRGLPGLEIERARLQRRRPSARRATTASRCSRSGRSTCWRPRLPGDPTTTARPATSRHRRRARRLDLPAERQPDRQRQVPLQARLDGPPLAHCRRCWPTRTRCVLGGDYNVARPTTTSTTRTAGGTTRSASRKPRAAFRQTPAPRPDRRVRAPCTRGRPTPSGTTAARAGRTTTACASTTCCSRRRPPTGCRRRHRPRAARLGAASDHTPDLVRTRWRD